MMTSVQSVAFSLMMMMMMMMGSVSAGPLPPPLNNSRHDDHNTGSHLLKNQQENSTRFESRQNVTLDVFTGDVTSNTTMNERSLSPFMFVLPLDRLEASQNIRTSNCVLSTCLTTNLGSALQGGDEAAGGATTDPLGFGKK